MHKASYEEKLLEVIDFTQRMPLADIVYLGLKEVILDGTYPLGERINENSLSTQLSISRTPIRKALDRLTEEGLVDHVHTYGTFVKSVNVDKIKELYKIRKSLEILLYEEVAKNATVEELDFLENSAAVMIVLEENNQVDELLTELNKFNTKINQIAKMTTLTSLLSDLNTYFRNFRNFSFNTQARRKLAVKEHQMMVQLIKANEIEYLKHAVEQHIDHAEIAAIQFFNSKQMKANLLKGTFYNPKKTTTCTPECPIVPKKMMTAK